MTSRIPMPQPQAISERYNQYKKTLATFPLKCKMYLSLLIGIQDEQCSNQIPKTLKKNYETLTNIFKRLSLEEREYFIGKNINFVLAHINTLQRDKIQQIEQIETTCEVRASFVGVSYWEKRNFKYEFITSTVRLSSSKKVEVVELKNYLVRKSLSEKYTLVLEGIEPSLHENKYKIYIRFANFSVFQEIYSNIRHSIIEISNKRLELLLGEDFKEASEKYQDEVLIKGLTFLTQKNINEYFSQKVEILKKMKAMSCRSFFIFNRGDLKIRNSTDSSKYYYLDYLVPKDVNSLEMMKDTINVLGSKTIPNRYYSEKLESFTQNINVKYYKITADSHECESVMIVETLERGGKLQQIMKATQNMFLGINIPFINIEVKKGEDKRFLLSLEVIIKSSNKLKNKSREIIKLLLSMISSQNLESFPSSLNQSLKNCQEDHIPHKKSASDHQQRVSEFNQEKKKSLNQSSTSKQEKDSSDDNEQIFYSIEDEEHFEDVQSALNSYSAKNVNVPTVENSAENKRKESEREIEMISYLSAKPFLVPREAEKKFISDGLLSNDWQKAPKGGVICINETVINEQKRVFKLACRQFGNKIFKMQGLMNFSLPVQILRTESCLISIARNFTYSPLLFENYSKLTPKERMINAVNFQVSMAILALSPQTPFNPILGETYQGQINGCPIYLEQISHHPPITYVNFIGRGFKIYGPIATQVCIRLNYIKAINSKWIVIEFDNGDRVEFTLPTMIINGMLFGDRTIYFDGINYIVDAKENIIAQITFNAGNKGFFGPKESPDYLTAHIYQVTPAFMEEFNASKRSITPKKDEKNTLLTTITGEWNGLLEMNGQTILDFEKNLPLLLQNHQHPLMSDSIYRTDAIQLIAGIMDKAQEQKQRLQQIQRKDKRLREAYSKFSKKK